MPGWRREAMQALARRARLCLFACGDHGRDKLALLTPFEKRHMAIPIYFHVSTFKILLSGRVGVYFYRKCQRSNDASWTIWSANA